ncbi:HAD family hydrolase [Nocardia cyriacigeorgica]|uniref:HAD family hydrolase n=1 Tax=Nocardia cyriacigeorgica TaxID=135487 RepID=UPI002454377E|nr:HAD family phosphatase [Nocardia cyriacigeorgica]
MRITSGNDRIAIWSDFGGVLTPPVEHTFAAFCRRTNIDPPTLRAALAEVTASFGTDDMMLPLDTPLISEDDWLALVSAALDRRGVRIRIPSLAESWFDGRAANSEWADTLLTYREAGFFVGMLSNMPPAWEPYWRRMVDPEALFAAVLNSAQIGCRKPDREIFDLAAARAGVEPARCVLIDDLPQNCAGARAAGWHAVLFTDALTAGAELEATVQTITADLVATDT